MLHFCSNLKTRKTRMNTYTRTGMALVATAAAVMLGGASAFAQRTEKEENDPVNAVVKLEVTTSTPSIRSPWKDQMDGGSGSGVVIGNGRILTCAHCVADATFIRIRKQNEEAIYQGQVEFVSHSCDLALVKVDDPKFMKNVTPSVLGETPSVQTEVIAVGYPMGGDGISFTRGIVSRVETHLYAQSYDNHLAIQVDAAINPGNSGGPVFSLRDGRIAGITSRVPRRGKA